MRPVSLGKVTGSRETDGFERPGTSVFFFFFLWLVSNCSVCARLWVGWDEIFRGKKKGGQVVSKKKKEKEMGWRKGGKGKKKKKAKRTLPQVGAIRLALPA